jgi:3-oxoacyl-[acyl-carrier protein] reductase
VTVAVVTGASRGIGRATAVALAEAGFAVGLVARSPAALEETRILVEHAGARAESVVADVTDPAAVAEAVARIEGEIGPIAVLVNNAGSLRAIGPLWEVDAGDWWADVATSLGGTFNLCHAVVPRMLGRRAGRIVNVTSYAAFRPAPQETGYAAAKAAVTSLTEALAASLGEHGIKAFAVAPGFTRTELTSRVPGGDERSALEPEQTGALVALIADGGADELNGRVLHTLDDVQALLGRLEEVREHDLYVPRLRRLS